MYETKYIQDLIEELSYIIKYFLKKQYAYDQLDNTQQQILILQNKKNKPLPKIQPRYLIILCVFFTAIFNKQLTKIVRFLTNKTVDETSLFNDATESQPIIERLIYSVVLPACIVIVIGIIVYTLYSLLHKLYYDKKISKCSASMIPYVQELCNHYNAYESTSGRQHLLGSFRYCNPRELNSIYQLLLSREAETIPEAKYILKANGKAWDYSFIPENYELQRNYKQQKKKTREKSSQSTTTSSVDTSNSPFFNGVTNLDQLKQRYRKLIKIYHTDDQDAGDNETAQNIIKEYQSLKKKYEAEEN